MDLRLRLALTVDCGLGELPPPIMDVILLETEWVARTVDILLEVSEEIVDSGRGINSKTSEKPTREGRCGPWGVCSYLSTELSACWVDIVTSGWEMDLSSSGGGGRWNIESEGVVGALPPFISDAGFKIIERS